MSRSDTHKSRALAIVQEGLAEVLVIVPQTFDGCVGRAESETGAELSRRLYDCITEERTAVN